MRRSEIGRYLCLGADVIGNQCIAPLMPQPMMGFAPLNPSYKLVGSEAPLERKPSFAIIGAGIGGLAVAAFLARQGAKVAIYEQAKQFLRIGAGIQMSPNAMRVLRALGLEPLLREVGFEPP